MKETIGALAQLGPVGIVLIILIVVGWQWRQSAGQARIETDRLKTWYTEELDRQESDHERDIRGLQESIEGLKKEVADLRTAWETERKARMAAEERAHQLRMGTVCSECGRDQGESTDNATPGN